MCVKLCFIMGSDLPHTDKMHVHTSLVTLKLDFLNHNVPYSKVLHAPPQKCRVTSWQRRPQRLWLVCLVTMYSYLFHFLLLWDKHGQNQGEFDSWCTWMQICFIGLDLARCTKMWKNLSYNVFHESKWSPTFIWCFSGLIAEHQHIIVECSQRLMSHV